MPNRPRRRSSDIGDDETDEDEEADRGSPWLGMVVHALLSWKARLGRMIRGAVRNPLPAGAQPLREARVRSRASTISAASPRRAWRPRRMRTNTTKKNTRTRKKPNPRRAAVPPPPPRRRRASPARASYCRRSISSPRRKCPSAPRCRRTCSTPTRPRWKACSAISACAARSSMRGPARSSRCTSSSPRPASSRRASSASPTTSPAR